MSCWLVLQFLPQLHHIVCWGRMQPTKRLHMSRLQLGIYESGSCFPFWLIRILLEINEPLYCFFIFCSAEFYWLYQIFFKSFCHWKFTTVSGIQNQDLWHFITFRKSIKIIWIWPEAKIADIFNKVLKTIIFLFKSIFNFFKNNTIIFNKNKQKINILHVNFVLKKFSQAYFLLTEGESFKIMDFRVYFWEVNASRRESPSASKT